MAEKFIAQSFINIPLWDRARWSGVAVICFPGKPPGMGLLFNNQAAGTEIFTDWKNRLGPIDEHDQLRVTIVEGPIVGALPGYNVRIGTNIPTMVRLASEHGHLSDTVAILTASRIHRMNPPPGSENLARFKRAYAQYKKFALVQVIRDQSPAGIIPVFETAIMKSEIFFRQVEDILEGDLDSDAKLAPPG